MTAYYIHFYRKVLAKQEGLLDRARLRILLTGILTFLLLTLILTLVCLVDRPGVLLYRMIGFAVLYSIALWLFFSAVPWRSVAHFFLSCLCLMIWTNVLLVKQNSYVINLQYCFLIISLAYYLFGSRNGIRYAAVAILPVLIDVLINDFQLVYLASRRANLNYTAYAITLLANFTLIVYIHYLFFRALTKFKIRELFYKRNLEAAVQESRSQATAKTNFLNTMSHEIRTPLNAIVGMSNLLLESPQLPEQEENLGVLHFSAQNLMATVNDIIDFNNLDHGQIVLQCKPFSLYETINNVCNTFKEQAKQKQLRLNCHIDEQLKNFMVSGDRLRLSQILFHLIGNSVKFTQVGFVEVMAHSINDGSGIAVSFKIEDSGIGISKEKLKQLFDPFVNKLLRTQRQYQANLGLMIAYQLLKLHDSELRITSREGKGTIAEFTIKYELAPLSKNHPRENVGKPTDLSGLKLLVVDDEKLNLMVVKKILARWRVTAEEASDGQVAVELCRRNSYDVVLMDINMPVMDGFAASKLIKQMVTETHSAPTIIALTASIGAAKDEVNRFPYIDDCLLKPFNPGELEQKLTALFK